MTRAELIGKLADAIQRMEGFYPPDERNPRGSRAWRNNNPGNIWDGLGGKKKKRIWPHLPIDEKGFVIYPNYQAGRKALEFQLKLDIGRMMTLEQLLTKYAPPHENDTGNYIRKVAKWAGIPEDKALADLVEEA